MQFIFILAVLMIMQGCRREEQSPETHVAAAVRPAMSVDDFLQAAHNGSLEAVNCGLEAGMDCNVTNQDGRTALMLAAFNGHTHVAERLITAGAKVNAFDLAGRTALMYASTAANGNTVRLLLGKGAKVDMVDAQEHWTALMFAAAEGQADVVRMLLAHGADRTLKDVDGDTALQFAVQRNHKAVVDILQPRSNP